MGALDQYLDLFGAHRDLIDAHGAAPLNAFRPAAAAALAEMRLPRRGDENFANIDMESLLATDYGLNLQKLPIDVNPDMTFRCDIPVSPKGAFININDTFVASASACDRLPDGVDAGSLRDFARLAPEEVSRFYGRLADMTNPIVALNTLFAQDGMYLRVRRGVRLEKPVELVNILANGMPLMAVRRLLIVVEDDAECKIAAFDHTQRDDLELMSLETVEMFVGRNARLDYYHVEESGDNTRRLSALFLSQQEGSQVNIDALTLFNGITRNEYYCRFAGGNAGLRLYGLGIEDRRCVLSTYSRISHDSPRCKSDELFKYTVDDDASGEFTGRILVAEGSVKTEAYQANRNLVGHSGAKMFSKPQLEIYNDDVKCSHGSATGQLDPMQVFYMRTRGLTEADARRLLRQAFMADVLAAIDIEPLRDRLQVIVDRRFAGVRSACDSCCRGL